MHPAIILVLLSIGGSLFGIWGLLLVVPVAATGRDLFSYVYRRLKEAEVEAEVHPT
jgi:predicted PurR-regulated permease PerM